MPEPKNEMKISDKELVDRLARERAAEAACVETFVRLGGDGEDTSNAVSEVVGLAIGVMKEFKGLVERNQKLSTELLAARAEGALTEHKRLCRRIISEPYVRGKIPCGPGESYEQGADYYYCSDAHPCQDRQELEKIVKGGE